MSTWQMPASESCRESNGEVPPCTPWAPHYLREKDTDNLFEMPPAQAIKFIYGALQRGAQTNTTGRTLQFGADQHIRRYMGEALPNAAGVWVCDPNGLSLLLAADPTDGQGMLRLIDPDTNEFANVRGDRTAVIGTSEGGHEHIIGIPNLRRLLGREQELYQLLAITSLLVTDSFPPPVGPSSNGQHS